MCVSVACVLLVCNILVRSHVLTITDSNVAILTALFAVDCNLNAYHGLEFGRFQKTSFSNIILQWSRNRCVIANTLS